MCQGSRYLATLSLTIPLAHNGVALLDDLPSRSMDLALEYPAPL
jgi:predicted ATPase with chaperone activity